MVRILRGLCLLSACLPLRAARNARCSVQMISNKATLGAGCYWGTEKFLMKDFNDKFPGTISNGKVGFMGGAKKYPTYREVCGGRSGRVEVYDMEYDGQESTFENILKFFFSFHDPTTVDQQGNDRGSQYVSMLHVTNIVPHNLIRSSIHVYTLRPRLFLHMMKGRKRLQRR